MENTPHQSPLDIVKETAVTRASFTSSIPVTKMTEPTCKDVSVRLSHSPISHFVCHGTTLTAKLSASHLLFTKYTARPFTVERVGKLKSITTKIAYLSACHTAVSRAQNLLDENINIATVFRVTSFPSVIGTLWQAFDKEAITLAGAFYRFLSRYENMQITGGGYSQSIA